MAQSVLQGFSQEWPECPAGLTLRHEQESDLDFVFGLYASTRAAEMAMVDWPEAMQQAFVRQQFSAQRSQYRLHYQEAAFLLLLREEAPIGRFYLDRTPAELRLMEITLTPAERGRGLGTTLMRRLIAWSEQLALPITLHVEPFNPAMKLYQRLGFETLEDRGVYHFMHRLP